MDVSSEMVHSLLPVFLVAELGASALFVGMLEGVAEATALGVRIFSGALSDWMGRRKPLVVAGYALGAASKPLFALAAGPGHVFAARVIDRIGKGIRVAPRDALIADVTPPEARGAAYGLRQSLDNVGAFVGPLLALALMAATAGDFRTVFWFALIPGSLAVLVLVVGVREPARHTDATGATAKPRPRLRLGELRRLRSAYWLVVAVGGVFTLARFSDAFLLLRARDIGVSPAQIPLALVVLNLVTAATSYPVGRLSDRIGRTGLLGAGMVALVAADLALGQAAGLGMATFGIALWGLHLGLTQGLLVTLVADTAPAKLRGTAMGFYSLASGIAMLAASLLAGWLWDRHGAPATFHASAALAAIAFVGFRLLAGRIR